MNFIIVFKIGEKVFINDDVEATEAIIVQISIKKGLVLYECIWFDSDGSKQREWFEDFLVKGIKDSKQIKVGFLQNKTVTEDGYNIDKKLNSIEEKIDNMQIEINRIKKESYTPGNWHKLPNVFASNCPHLNIEIQTSGTYCRDCGKFLGIEY